MVDIVRRRAFADFLERLARGEGRPDDWDEYAVNHYKDETLEECRRNCVRLSIEAGEPFPRTDEHRAQLRAWASELRPSAAA
jgi:hypothetical protein